MNLENLIFGVLFYCRTPLQSLIICQIIKQIERPFYIIYHPNSQNPKHQIYFEALPTINKIFVPWLPIRMSDALTHLIAYWRVPTQIRKLRFSEIYFASIGCITLSLLIKNNPKAALITFDDGSFNVSTNVDGYQKWVFDEHWSRRLLKRLLRTPDNITVDNKTIHHYTIYSRTLIRGIKRDLIEISLISNTETTPTCITGKKLRVLLGMHFVSYHSGMRPLYNSMVASNRFDLCLPHPGNTDTAVASRKVLNILSIESINKMIAEDIVMKLVISGHKVIVYGFGSSALVILSKVVRVVDIKLDGPPNQFSKEQRTSVRMKQIKVKKRLSYEI
jgi:hypothetical protein